MCQAIILPSLSEVLIGLLHPVNLASRWSHVGCYFLPGRIVASPCFLSFGLLVFKGGEVSLFVYFFFFIIIGGRNQLGIVNTY